MPNHLIPVDNAAEMISKFGSQKESILTDGFQNAGTLPVCETFDRDAFDIILEDSNCTAIRIYLGMDENSKVRLIVAGVNSNDEDIMIPAAHTSNSFDVNCVIETGIRCPNDCPPASLLNS